MNTLTWLHLSDLHFRASQAYNSNVVLKALLRDIRERIQNDSLHPDFIAVTGDIAFSGQPAEYALARAFLDDLLAATDLPRERLFLVPGNHDANRSLVSRGAAAIGAALTDRESANAVLVTPDDRRLVMARFKGYAEFINSYLPHLPFDDEHYFCVRTPDMAGQPVALLGLNSAWLCTSDRDKADGLLIGERQARTALEQAASAKLKIALLHHPFDHLREFDQDDSAALLTDGCDLILHGHLHRTAATQLITPDSRAMVLACGACYETREWPNMYNWVRLDLATGQGTVHLRRYSDARGGFWALDALTYKNVPQGAYSFSLRRPPVKPPGGRGPQLPPASKPPADRCRDYLNALIGDCNRLRLSGLDPTASDPTRARPMTLDQVYVGQDTRTMRELERDRDAKPDELARRRMESEQKLLSALEAISRAPNGRAVLLGQPGSGKSTLARYLALRLAQAHKRDDPGAFDFGQYLPGWERGALLPVVVALGRLAQSLPAEAKHGTADMVTAHLRSDTLNCYNCGEWVADELERVGGLVILDGLDEVPADKRVRIQQAIRQFADQHPNCVCLVTCRTFSYRRDPGWQLGAEWPVFELAPFDGDKIEHFIAAWYAALIEIEPKKRAEYDGKAAKLRAALAPSDARQLYQLAGVPLLLTVMAAVHTHENELPGSRALIYEKCVGLLLERWASERTPGAEPVPLLKTLNLPDRSLLDKALHEVAFRAHESGDWRRTDAEGSQPALVTEGLLKEVMERWLDPERATTFVEYCRTSNGLLMAFSKTRLPDSSPDAPLVTVYTFPHLTFEEFLAARHVQSLGGAMPGRAAQLAADVRWREVILFLIEYLCVTNSDWQATEVLRRLCPADEPKRAADWRAADWRAAWLAGEGLPALRRVTIADTRDAELDARIVHRLEALLMAGSTTGLPASDRAAAGRALSVLGDSRPGVTLSSLPTPSPLPRIGRGEGARGWSEGLPDILWSNIPSGTLMMGSRRGETFQTPRGQEEPYDDEYWPNGQPRAIQIKSFKLAAYPITVAQFRPFVQDPQGWTNNEWWTQNGLRDRGESQAPHNWDDPQWCIDNHPVVGVTWYVAVAYCRWLTARLCAAGMLPASAVVRLPTEAEWEWAARGGPPSVPPASRGEEKRGRCWPWGDDWRGDACNSEESQIGRTSAVGIFPPTPSPVPEGDGGGAGWGPVYDLAGNVWEWCSTRWQSYDDTYPAIKGMDEWTNKYLDGDALRVLRGGSFNNEARNVRGVFRFRYYPWYWFPRRGFSLRVCVWL